MKYPFALSLLLFLLSGSPAFAGDEAPVPGSVTPEEGRVAIGPAIQLPVNAAPPVPCSTKTLGTLTLDSNAQLCICDGAAWKLANATRSCIWSRR
jgi:hypothetical protein